MGKKSKNKTSTLKVREVQTTTPGQTSVRGSADFVHSKDFPELKPSLAVQKVKKNEKIQFGSKSWMTVVDSNKDNFDKIFPQLPKVKSLIKSETVSKDAQKPTQKDALGSIKNEIKETIKLETEKPKKKKQKSGSSNTELTPKKNPNKKKRADPIFLNINDIIKVNRDKKKSQPHKIVKSKFHRFPERDNYSGNVLDSSKPIRSRGKHREVKKKKLTSLKLAIIKERIIKKKIRENSKGTMSEITEKEIVNLLQSIDFKLEIKKYLDDLKEKKAKAKVKAIEKKEKQDEVPESQIKEKKEVKSALDGQAKLKPILEKEIKVEKPESEEVKKEGKSVEGEEKKIAGEVAVEKPFKFSSKQREYCDNVITPGLNSAVTELIRAVVNLQDKLYARDPLKGQARRRHVSGFKEVRKYLIMKKVKIIVMPPDMEKLQMKGSVYDVINELKTLANSKNVPYVFALSRYKLGRCTKKNVPVCAFAVINYEGADSFFHDVLRKSEEAKKQFLALSKPISSTNDVTAQVISSFVSVFNEGLRIS